MDFTGRLYGYARLNMKYFKKGCEVAYDKMRNFNLLDSIRKVNSHLENMIAIAEKR